MSKPAPSSRTKYARPSSFAVTPNSTCAGERLAETVDAAERGAQVVGHRIRKRLELLVGRLELRGVAPPLVLALFAGRDVANDRREGDFGSVLPGRER